MLVLTRRIKEALFIGENVNDKMDPKKAVKIEILGIKGSQVRIGIDAPDNINILREELLEKQEV